MLLQGDEAARKRLGRTAWLYPRPALLVAVRTSTHSYRLRSVVGHERELGKAVIKKRRGPS